MRDTSKTCFIDCFKQSLLFSFLAFSLFLGSSEAVARTSPFCVSIAESPLNSSAEALHTFQGRDSVSENQDKNHGKLETLPVWKEGGSAGMYEFVKKNLHYPEESAKKRIQGKVIVRFIIDKDGSVTNAKVTRSVDSLLDKEALRVVGIMPRWTPGSFNGNPAKAYFVLPITFTLDSLHVKSFIKPLVASGNCPLIVVNGEIKDYPIDSQKKLVENGFIEKEAVANWFKVRVRDVKKIEIVQPKKAIELFGVKGTKDGVVKYTIKNMPYEKVDKPATWKEGGNTALFSFLSANLK